MRAKAKPCGVWLVYCVIATDRKAIMQRARGEGLRCERFRLGGVASPVEPCRGETRSQQIL